MGEILNLRRLVGQTSVPSLHAPAAVSAAVSLEPLALLLAETAAGNERAFARLYELTSGRMRAIARGIVGRTDVADDIVQESFLRVWRWAHRYDPNKGPAYAWLVRIVRNRALSAKDQLHRREDGHCELDAEALVFPDRDPADQAMRSEEARQVKACLANLPLNHRRSVTLVYFEGLTHRELAARLGVQLGTAKSWVRRGLAQISRCMSGGADADWRELVAAQYAVGSLQGASRLGFERRRERDARYCHAVDAWENRLALLTEFLPDNEPVPLDIWNRIAQQIQRERVYLSRPLFWQATSVGLALAALALLVLVLR
ncbi:sigma-70 family RNA polymerase sigma factor [Reyranella sp.]|jgi:RNA polymerase sigma-70 factor (ECF subfamily)|uniref:sigma-70 family RNA polymerase sigma factor n=1 Tax=Reyranella sp. TaxID=1929291 RepID=UPI002F95A562